MLGMCEMTYIDGDLTGTDPLPVPADKETVETFIERNI